MVAANDNFPQDRVSRMLRRSGLGGFPAASLVAIALVLAAFWV